MKKSEYPPGWDEDRARAVIDHYDRQTEDEAVAEYEAALVRRAAPGGHRFGQDRAGERASEVAERAGEYDANQEQEDASEGQKAGESDDFSPSDDCD